MLTKMQDGKYHLEDPDAHIELEFPDNVYIYIYIIYWDELEWNY